MPVSAAVLLLIGGGVALLAARKGKGTPAAPAAPSAPGGIPGLPPLPGIPGAPLPGAPLPGVPGAGAGATTATGCPLDANFPAALIPQLNETLTRADIPATVLQAAAFSLTLSGFPLAGQCASKRAAEVGQQKGEPGPDPAMPRPPWYPQSWPWPPPLTVPWGSAAPAPAPGTDPNAGWGPAPIPGVPWPPPFPPPAGWTPGMGLPVPPAPAPAPGEPVPPPPAHGGAEWGPRPPLYPPSWPWPPMAPFDPEQNPTVGDAYELQVQPGDTPSGYAYYYSGHGPAYDSSGTVVADVDMGPMAVRLVQFANANGHLHGGQAWEKFQPGAPLYVPISVADARGLPPVPTGVYQQAAGFVPRADMMPPGVALPLPTTYATGVDLNPAS